MYLQILETSQIGIEQSYEAENSFVELHLSRMSILQGFTFKTKIIEGD